VPKIKSIPSMLPGVGATVAAAGGGVAAGGPLGLMLGSVVAGGALNKAMDRGAKRAKAARLAMARTPAERRWAAKRNQQVYFSEVGALTREMEAAFGDLSHRLRVHRFAWKQGKRGGRYKLPDGREDRPANRLYGAKAEAASKAAGARGGEKAPRGGPRPGEEQRVARAKFEVARDAHQAAVQARLPQDRIDWLRGRMESAQKELEAKRPEAARRPTPTPGGTAAERSAMDAMARAEVGTPAYEAAKTRYVRARRAAKAQPGREAEGFRPLGWLRDRYKQLQGRYGSTGAALTVAGMALPVPGTVVAAPLAAEAVLRARKFLGLSESA